MRLHIDKQQVYLTTLVKYEYCIFYMLWLKYSLLWSIISILFSNNTNSNLYEKIKSLLLIGIWNTTVNGESLNKNHKLLLNKTLNIKRIYF